MELSVAILVLAGALAATAAVLFVRRPQPAPPVAAPTADVGPALRTEVQRTLSATEQQVVTQTGATQRSLSELSRQLGGLSEQSTRIGDLAKDIGSLQDLLRAPKARGGFGELMLERLLQDCLPATAYSVQYTYRDGSRVDAVVRYGARIVPIDSKFPSESYTQIAGARDEADRRSRRRSFLQQVRRHVDSVGRYVSPQDSTIDYAFMYLPSEAIYYELTIHDASPDEPDILAYCAEHHVIPASPNTLLAYLQVVALGLRGLAMQERTRDLQQGIAQVRREFERFVELHDQLGKHLDNATKKFDETERALARASGAIEGLAQVPIAAGSEQSVLPLGLPEDEP
jgi:DNA recombination protein RmuC